MLPKLIARLLRIFFHWLYHPFAWTYDFVAAAVSLGQWKDWVMMTLPHLGRPRLLELGFGPGHLLAALTSRGVSAFGVDSSPQMAQLARRRLHKSNQVVRLVNAYAQTLPFPNESFDQIVTTFPPEFILAQDTYSEAYRVLAPGGTMVILLTAWITGKRSFEKVAAWLFRITGQAPDWEPRFLEPISRAGLQPRVERVTRKSWTLVIILAYKVQGETALVRLAT